MIKTPLSTVIGGAFWTPGCTVIGGASKTLNQIIKSLFANNKQGFAYDPNDLTTMFQDSEGTIPVTGAGQPVWHILDKSGNNNHAFATSSATRPILRQNAITKAYYLEFDGSDDFLKTNNIDFTSTDEMSLFVGIKKMSDASRAMAVELGNNQPNSIKFSAPDTATAMYAVYSQATATTNLSVGLEYKGQSTNVITAKAKLSAGSLVLRVDGAVKGQRTAVDQGAGNFGNLPLYIGRRGGTSLAFNGHIYSLIGVGRLTTDNETTALEKLIAKNTGVTLSV